jgi:hypothetical protein
MAGQLKPISTLQTELETAGNWGITKQALLDILQSLVKVGGSMSITAGTTPITLGANWKRIDTWERSIDTQGVVAGLNDATDPGGYYRVPPAGVGDYSISASVRATVSVAGDYELRLVTVLDGVTTVTPYRDKVAVPAGSTTFHMMIGNGTVKNILPQTRMQLEIKGPNGAVVTITHGSWGVLR